jgi:hypothetical protein
VVNNVSTVINMDHVSNRDIEKLHDLILVFDKMVFKLDPESGIHTNLPTTLAKIKYDITSLQNLVVSHAQFIYSRTPSSYLKATVNSVLDSMSVDDTLAELKRRK